MRETIWLTVDRYTVKRMTKNMPTLNRGEVPIKLEVIVDAKAYVTPTLAAEVHIVDWREGVDLGDVDFKEMTITEQEAELIRARRLAAMVQTLTERGFTVIDKDGNPNPVEADHG